MSPSTICTSFDSERFWQRCRNESALAYAARCGERLERHLQVGEVGPLARAVADAPVVEVALGVALALVELQPLQEFLRLGDARGVGRLVGAHPGLDRGRGGVARELAVVHRAVRLLQRGEPREPGVERLLDLGRPRHRHAGQGREHHARDAGISMPRDAEAALVVGATGEEARPAQQRRLRGLALGRRKRRQLRDLRRRRLRARPRERALGA
jgi:hypothetical protein